MEHRVERDRPRALVNVGADIIDIESAGERQQRLECRHEALKSSHLHLKGAIRDSVYTAFQTHGQASAIMKDFADKSMATIAAWMLAQTSHAAISRFTGELTDHPRINILISRGIYAVLMTVFVPLLTWKLRKHALDANISIGADQIQLLKLCLPMFFAWGWKDFISAVINLKRVDQILWPEFLVAMGLTMVIGFIEVTPCFRQSVLRVHAGGAADTPCARMQIMPGSLGLAVGFAWNTVCSWASKELQAKCKAPLFVMMIQMVYFLFMGCVITSAYLKWYLAIQPGPGGRDGAAGDAGQAAGPAPDGAPSPPLADGENRSGRPQALGLHLNVDGEPDSTLGGRDPDADLARDLESRAPVFVNLESGRLAEYKSAMMHYENECVHQFGAVTMDALTFVYAWAQLDTVNSFFFTYLEGCTSAQTCSYQSNFGFALALTVSFAKLANVMKAERRLSGWNQASSALTTKAMSLNVGWVWINFCSAAISNAVESSGATVMFTHIVCACFSWLVISVMHRKFEIERRAWDRHVKHQTLNHGIGLAI